MEQLTRIQDTEDNPSLLERFNGREAKAFSEVYLLFHDELFYYASNLYRNTEIAASDVLQDVFMNVWKNSSRAFDSVRGIKTYLYISIRNNFRNYISHSKYVSDYRDHCKLDRDMFEVDLIESEIYSLVNHALQILPEDCAKIFKLLIDGWNVEEIAEQFGKTKKAIYHKKYEAIEILKRKLPKDKLLLIIMLIS